MSKREKMFFILWGFIFFPLLLLYLRLHFGLDAATVATMLAYLAGMHGWQAFDNWNKSP
jgi:hypothetical protein